LNVIKARKLRKDAGSSTNDRGVAYCVCEAQSGIKVIPVVNIGLYLVTGPEHQGESSGELEIVLRKEGYLSLTHLK
jgi:hypothetical protein